MADDNFYTSFKWRQTRAQYLAAHPLCIICLAIGMKTPAVDLDHIRPIRRGGSPYDPANLQSLCKTHHSQKTIGRDGGGGRKSQTRDYIVTGADGFPIESMSKRVKLK